jgi:hypothetical protein
MWSRTSGELFYRNGDKMIAATVRTGDRLIVSKPQLLWTGRYSHGMSTSCGAPGPTSANYDVSADGSRFFMIEDKAQDIVARQIHVVLNWAQQLKGLQRDRK